MAGEEKYGTKAIIALLADVKNKISDIAENAINKEDFKELTDKVTALEEQLDTKEDIFSPGEGLEMTEDRILNITLDLEIFWVNSIVPDTLPVGKSNKILLVPNPSSTDEGNYYTEYIWVVDTEHPDGHYEELGTYKSNVDLSAYQTKQDNNLQTIDKTIVGAINEVKQNIDNKDYIIDMASLLSASTSNEINNAIGGWDNLINAIENNKTVKLAVIQDNKIIGVYLPIIIFNSSDSLDLVMSEISYNAIISISYNDGELTQIFDESYVSYIYDYGYLYDYNGLSIRFDTIKNSIKKETVSRITYKDNKQNPLIYGVGYTHSIYDEENNIIKVYSPFYDKEQKKLICNKIVETIITSDGNTSVSIKTLQETTDNNLNTNSKEVIGAINEINAKSGYYINVSTINNNSTSEEISEAIGGYDNLLNAINNKIPIYVYSTVFNTNSVYPVVRAEVDGRVISMLYIIGNGTESISIINNDGVLSCSGATVYLQTTEDYTLNTSSKIIVQAINEINYKTPLYTIVPTLTSDYTIPANATTREYIYEISIGATTYNVTAAEGIKWIDNNLPLVEANSKLIVSVVNNIAVWGTVYE